MAKQPRKNHSKKVRTENPAKPSLRKVTRVMIVDDHELLRDGLRQLIIRQPNLQVCGEASNEREARSLVRDLRPDLVIVDLMLQESSGLDLIKWIRQELPNTKVIVSSMLDERDYGERALRAGAVGYANKQAPARTILTAIARVLEGKLFFSEALAERLMHRATFQTDPADESPVAALSNREVEILSLIGAGLSTDQIAQRLHLSPNTIGTYRERLKTKLDLKGSAELSHFATLWVAEKG
jgi:DNA-binding NarL/FixJ family response regulator